MSPRPLLILAVCAIVALAGCAALDDPTGTDDTILDDLPDDGETPVDSDDPDGTATPTETTSSDDEPVDGELEVHAINVGQADATLVIGPEGDTMLVDSGDWRDDGEVVIDYLDAHDVDRLDHLVTTHPHADHIGGHAAVIEHLETERDGVGAVWDPGTVHTSQTYERYLDAVDEHDVDLFRTQAGDEIPMAGLDVRVLNPPADTESEDFHENSVTAHVRHGDSAFLFTGDAEAETESRLVDTYGTELDVDVLHAGHHGSRTSSSEKFLDTVSPETAIVSSDYDSQYGHPHEEVLERLSERDIETYWTATHGTTVFVSDGEVITAKTQTDATAEPLALRDEPETDADPTVPPTESARQPTLGPIDPPRLGAIA